MGNFPFRPLIALLLIAFGSQAVPAQRVLVADPPNQQLIFIDTQSGEESTLPLGLGSEFPVDAMHVVSRGQGNVVYLGRYARSGILVADPHRGSVVGSIPVGFWVTKFIPLADGRHIFACGHDVGVLIDTSTDSIAGPEVFIDSPVGLVDDEIMTLPGGWKRPFTIRMVNPFDGRTRNLPIEDQVRDVVLDLPRKRMVLIGGDGGLAIATAATAEISRRIYTRYPIQRLTIAPDGSFAYAIDDRAEVLEIGLSEGRVRRLVPVSPSDDAAISFSGDGALAYIATPTGVVVWSTIANAIIERIADSEGGFAMAPDGWSMVVFHKEPYRETVGRIVDLRGFPWSSEEIETAQPSAVAFSGDSRFSYVATKYGLVFRDRDRGGGPGPFGVSLTTPDAAFSARLVVRGNRAFVPLVDAIAVIDVETQSISHGLSSPLGDRVRSMDVSNDGQAIFVSLEYAKSPWRYDAVSESWTELPFPKRSDEPRLLGVSGSGTRLLVADAVYRQDPATYYSHYEGRASILNAKTGAVLSDVSLGPCEPRSIVTDPSGRRAAITCDEAGGSVPTRVVVVDFQSGEVVDGLQGPDPIPGYAVHLTPSGALYTYTSVIDPDRCASGRNFLAIHASRGVEARHIKLPIWELANAAFDAKRNRLIALDVHTASLVITDVLNGTSRALPSRWSRSQIVLLPDREDGSSAPLPALNDRVIFNAGARTPGVLDGALYRELEDTTCSNADGQRPSGSIVDVGLSSDGATAFLLTSTPSLVVSDVASGRPVATIPLPFYPAKVVLSADNALAYLRPEGGDGIGIVDLDAKRFVTSIVTDHSFEALVPSRDPAFVYAREQDRIAVIDSRDATISRWIDLGANPTGVEAPSDRSHEEEVSDFVVDEERERLYVVRKGIWHTILQRFPLAGGSPSATAEIATKVDDIELGPNGNLYVAAFIRILELDQDLTFRRSFPGGNDAESLRASRDGRFLYAVADDLRVFDLATGEVAMTLPTYSHVDAIAVACGRDCPPPPAAPMRTPADTVPTPLPTATPTPWSYEPTPTPEQEDNTLRVESVALEAGEATELAVYYFGTSSVSMLQHEMYFDPQAGVAAWVDGQPDCIADAPQAIFTFIPLGCMPSRDCRGMQVVLRHPHNRGYSDVPRALYRCRIEVAHETVRGTYPVSISAPALKTERCDTSVAVAPRDGAIVVGGEATILPSSPIEPSCGISGGFANELCVASVVADTGGVAELSVDVVPGSQEFPSGKVTIPLPPGLRVSRDAASELECRDLTTESALNFRATQRDCGQSHRCETLSVTSLALTVDGGRQRLPLFRCMLEVDRSAVAGEYPVEARLNFGGAGCPEPMALVAGRFQVRAAPTATPTPSPLATATATGSPTPTIGDAGPGEDRGSGGGCTMNRDPSGRSTAPFVLLVVAVIVRLQRRDSRRRNRG